MSGTSNNQRGSLYLIPNLLGETPPDTSLPPLVASITARISHFVVEEEKSARRYIKQLCPERVIREISFQTLNEHSKPEEIEPLLSPLLEGHDVGVVSEAGCPGIADPGADLVRRAHEIGITVHPLVGPCSMTLALMASGFNGQRWRFLGYLPVDDGDRRSAIVRLENLVASSSETQIIMETPYRNQKLLQDLLAHCQPNTRLCVASGLTTPAELVEVHAIAEWRQLDRTLLKTPALFLLGS